MNCWWCHLSHNSIWNMPGSPIEEVPEQYNKGCYWNTCCTRKLNAGKAKVRDLKVVKEMACRKCAWQLELHLMDICQVIVIWLAEVSGKVLACWGGHLLYGGCLQHSSYLTRYEYFLLFILRYICKDLKMRKKFQPMYWFKTFPNNQLTK